MSGSAVRELQPGEARFPGPSTKEIILADGQENPKQLLTESYVFMGDEDLPFDRYTSQEFFGREMEKMWPKVWQWACREDHIPEVGDNYVYDVGYHSIIVVRVAEDSIKAYYNSCMHRGTQLRPSHSQGSSVDLRCPFHGWTWNLDGSLKELPCEWDFPHVDKADFALPEVKVGLWDGFVFINMDPDAMPLEDYLEVLPDHFANWPLEDRYVELHIQKTLPANWKASQEAFIEAYHALETHWQGKEVSGTLMAQYDVFGDHVNRFVHTRGYPTPEFREGQSEQDILDKMIPPAQGIIVPEGSTARAVLADVTRKTLGEKYRLDLSEATDSDMLDSIEYHLFPNMFLFPGVGLPMIYRFRPNGMDPDSAIFDLLFLRILPEGEERPEPPAPYKIGVDESYADVPGMDERLGAIYDQDTGNLDMQQRGFKAASKSGQTLGNYQEVRIRRVHRTLDQYLSA